MKCKKICHHVCSDPHFIRLCSGEINQPRASPTGIFFRKEVVCQVCVLEDGLFLFLTSLRVPSIYAR
jgi:hypothetical protein